MASPYKLKEIEKEHGVLTDLIPALVNELGSQKAAADHLGISQYTVSVWLRENGYIAKTVYIKSEEMKGEMS